MTPKASRTLPLAEVFRIVSLYGFSSPQDFVIEDLAMAMGIFVVDARLDSAAARLVRSDDCGLVRVSDKIHRSGRRRFAIAHEIGHFVMHKKVSQLLACTDVDILASYKSNRYEIEASIFAAALLMPKEPFLARAAGAPPTIRVIKYLASHFDTSLTATATAIRYVETSTDYCVLVVSENGTIRWWRASDSFGNHDLWIETKNVLPRFSSAASFFRDRKSREEPIEVDFKDWFGDLPDVDSDYVIEQAIPLPKYDQVISMIWLP